MIIEDNFQKENISFYQYSEFENVKLIGGNVYKATFKKTVAPKCVSLNDKFTLDNLINEKFMIAFLGRFYGITEQENSNNYMIILEYSNNDSLLFGHFQLGINPWEISGGKPHFEKESSPNIDLLNNIVKGKREIIIPGTPSKYQKLYTDGNLRPDISQVVKNLSEITISDISVEFETSWSHPHDITDEVNSAKLEKQNNKLEVHYDSPSIDVSTEIVNLFEIFIDLCKKQDQKECNKNPVKVLNEMIRRPSYYWLTSLIGFFPCMKKAFQIYSKVADEGSLIALETVFKLYLKSAEEGYLLAQFDVDYCYTNGKGIKLKGFNGVDRDESEAFKWYSKAAEKGHSLTQNNLGNYLF
ncbi:hypothetical protein Glove_37g60 [Diversispora epigaea]|uniref:HCP-like protein n=1 Tax=Diversispora epigaea TaxID=1348612 RepID=A0A397JQU3_9GLOM|nr:hypothetical protein Glove_37g60 [Diversispora epigaea]